MVVVVAGVALTAGCSQNSAARPPLSAGHSASATSAAGSPPGSATASPSEAPRPEAPPAVKPRLTPPAVAGFVYRRAPARWSAQFRDRVRKSDGLLTGYRAYAVRYRGRVVAGLALLGLSPAEQAPGPRQQALDFFVRDMAPYVTARRFSVGDIEVQWVPRWEGAPIADLYVWTQGGTLTMFDGIDGSHDRAMVMAYLRAVTR